MTDSRRDPVADELAIRDLVNRHAAATCRRDPVGVAGNFLADGVWESERLGRVRGREEMSAFFSGLLDGWNLLLQGLLSGHVDLDPVEPDRATGCWYIWEFGQSADGTDFVASGIYDDEYVRDSGRWWFARRRYGPLLRRTGEEVVISPFPADVPSIE